MRRSWWPCILESEGESRDLKVLMTGSKTKWTINKSGEGPREDHLCS